MRSHKAKDHANQRAGAMWSCGQTVFDSSPLWRSRPSVIALNSSTDPEMFRVLILAVKFILQIGSKLLNRTVRGHWKNTPLYPLNARKTHMSTMALSSIWQRLGALYRDLKMKKGVRQAKEYYDNPSELMKMPTRFCLNYRFLYPKLGCGSWFADQQPIEQAQVDH